MSYGPSSMKKTQKNDKKQEFWTDSNGRQMVRRVQDTRFSYDLNDGVGAEPISSNYYPINSGKYKQKRIDFHSFPCCLKKTITHNDP